MRNKSFFVFLFVLVILTTSSFGVSASTVQATSTPDFRTPPPTYTPGSSNPFVTAEALNFDCPVGTPIGADVTIPDAGWLAACGQCLSTPTPWATLQDDSSNFPLQCDGPGCFQVDSDTVYLSGSQGSSYDTWWQFFTLVDSDIYVYGRFSGYSTFSYLHPDL